MKLPFSIGTKWILILAILITAIIVAPVTAKITSKIKDGHFARIEKLYQSQNERLFSAYEKLAEKARYEIKQTFTVKKNHKGQIIYVPSSTMEIDKIIDSIDSSLVVPIDSAAQNPKPKTLWDELRFWK